MLHQHRPQGPAAEDVNVEMRDFLMRIRAGIGENAVAGRHEPKFVRDLADGAEEAGDQIRRRLRREVGHRHIIALRDHQNMDRRLRVDVMEGK